MCQSLERGPRCGPVVLTTLCPWGTWSAAQRDLEPAPCEAPFLLTVPSWHTVPPPASTISSDQGRLLGQGWHDPSKPAQVEARCSKGRLVALQLACSGEQSGDGLCLRDREGYLDWFSGRHSLSVSGPTFWMAFCLNSPFRYF